MPHYTAPHAFAPLSDAEFAALAPYLHREGPGRPIDQPRETLDAIFSALLSNNRWSHRGEKHDTLHRRFRRWAHAGLWTRLLTDAARSKALRPLRYRICRAYRAAIRVLGVHAIALARRLGFLTALPGPPWMLPDPILSETVTACFKKLIPIDRLPDRSLIPLLRTLRALLRTAGGRRIRRCLAPP
ncbi:transposase [Plastoroseomonas arctica]|uniref:Transposase n=1 Tax=Plastoroseomonas arctica TaxID=1509237 RepID=A0AAF1KNG6_9PROT|nr:transposase [Plastoroseomonas arctica]MBR0657581.1 transposase [Plastoroseomonas arctica]